MSTTRNTPAIAVLVAALGLALPTTSWAGHPVPLSDAQLDAVTAGGAAVLSSSNAGASGVFTLDYTTSNSVVFGGATPFPQQPGLTNSLGISDGTAVAMGTNIGNHDAPPPSSGTSVTTAGTAVGNQVIITNFNYTTQGAGGLTFQAGWTVAYGGWTGL